jgi:hypothetical protein
MKGKGKLVPRYVGPFQVLERVERVTYHIKLLEGAHLHNTFHVGCSSHSVGNLQ